MASTEETDAERIRGTWRMPSALPQKGGLMGFFESTHPLRVYNSLTKKLTPFVPMQPGLVTMYVCGPTVYDAAHMGHARTYLQFDVLRRILRDYFGYRVVYVQNVTDVDDKIIIRSNEKGIPHTELSRHWEREYLADMQRLGIEPPTSMPRVTEYMPEIVAYVERIVANGYGYESNGSVYFDTAAFQAAGFTYKKLVPENVGDAAALLAEGEGKLAAASDDKRNNSDFALWKASKANEPSWESPWGAGRPGWHIECSAMVHATLGQVNGGSIDIHGGGVDLKFPHHDNECAQSEAHCECKQWCNYFLHTGHLHISGLKMSKSLKNFITIGQALDGVAGPDGKPQPGISAALMRIMFMCVKYNAPMDYSDNMIVQARGVEKKFREFFLNVKAAVRESTGDAAASHKWTDRELLLSGATVEAQKSVHEALCDDFNTPAALGALQALVDACNKYLASGPVVSFVLRAAAMFVTKIFTVFGLVDPLAPIGFGAKGAEGGGAVDVESTVSPFLDLMSTFRDEVREAARAGDAAKVLELADLLRDDHLPTLGVRLEDRPGTTAVWKFDDVETLRAERDAAEEERLKKEAARAAAAAKQAAKEAQARIDPREMFLARVGEFSKFDADGIPTHAADGEEIPKSGYKKLKKEWAAQSKAFEKGKAVVKA